MRTDLNAVRRLAYNMMIGDPGELGELNKASERRDVSLMWKNSKRWDWIGEIPAKALPPASGVFAKLSRCGGRH